jgi:23S rRNA pseudouridine2605 synthase
LPPYLFKMKKKSSHSRDGARGPKNDRSRPATGRGRTPRTGDGESRPARSEKSSSWDDYDRENSTKPSTRSEGSDRSSERSTGSREEGKGMYQRREDNGDRPSYPRRDDGARGERKSYGDREKRPYQRREDSGDRPAFPRRDSGDGGERKSYGDREKRPYQRREDSGDRPAFPRRDSGDGGERKSYGDREKRPYQRREDSGDRPSFPRRDDGERGERKSYGDREKRPYQRREDSGDRPSFPRRDDGERGERKSYGDREKRPYQRREDSGDRPAFPRRDSGDGGERKSYGDREKRPYQRREDSGDRPSFPRRDDGERGERKSYGDREKRPYQRREDSGDRPSFPRRDDGDKGERKSYGDREKRPYSKRPDAESRHNRFEEKQSRGRGGYSRGGDRRSAPRKRNASEGPDLTGEIRLNRFISMAGIGSRREADDLITAGLISVNGNLVTELGSKVKPGDDIRYNGERIRNEKHVYLLLNKPKDYITTAEDPNDRKTVMELIAGACPERVYPVGRLDRNTTGLLLFTNDGDLAKHLTHPSSRVKKLYHVELDKNVKVADIRKLQEGIELEDGLTNVDDISFDGDGSDKKVVGVELHSGKNRVVRRLFEALGYDVKKLDRVGFAGLTKKDLPRGRWRMLDEREVGFLKMMGTGKKKLQAD